jgi:hypothetical protein
MIPWKTRSAQWHGHDIDQRTGESSRNQRGFDLRHHRSLLRIWSPNHCTKLQTDNRRWNHCKLSVRLSDLSSCEKLIHEQSWCTRHMQRNTDQCASAAPQGMRSCITVRKRRKAVMCVPLGKIGFGWIKMANGARTYSFAMLSFTYFWTALASWRFSCTRSSSWATGLPTVISSSWVLILS